MIDTLAEHRQASSGGKHFKSLLRQGFLLAVSMGLSSCGAFDFFSDDQTPESAEETGGEAVVSPPVLGAPLPQAAGSVDSSALDALYAITTTNPPAPIRPDPDLYVRLMLKQYQPVSAPMARLIGRLEAYRPLLGGASLDFQKPPQETYDATSLLAQIQVSEAACEALIDPNPQDYQGWTSILPGDPSQVDSNIRILAQRFIGLPTARIPDTVLTSLRALFDQNRADQAGTDGGASSGAGRSVGTVGPVSPVGTAIQRSDYVPVCVALSLDAEALWL